MRALSVERSLAAKGARHESGTPIPQSARALSAKQQRRTLSTYVVCVMADDGSPCWAQTRARVDPHAEAHCRRQKLEKKRRAVQNKRTQADRQVHCGHDARKIRRITLNARTCGGAGHVVQVLRDSPLVASRSLSRPQDAVHRQRRRKGGRGGAAVLPTRRGVPLCRQSACHDVRPRSRLARVPEKTTTVWWKKGRVCGCKQ